VVTSTELAIGSLVVAVVAIIAGVLSTRFTASSQRRQASEQFLIEQRTKTYLDMLAATTGKREGSIDSALYRMEGELTARIEAFASSEVHKAWTNYIVVTARYERSLRGDDEVQPAEYFPTWEHVKDVLISQIRHDIGTPGPFTLSEVQRADLNAISWSASVRTPGTERDEPTGPVGLDTGNGSQPP
jgi:hypothetical protein